MKASKICFIIPIPALLFLVSILFLYYHEFSIIPKLDYFDPTTIVTKVLATEVSNNTNNNSTTNTPISHIVIIFPENIAFDHYFATYPIAKNPANEPHFSALPNTHSINGLTPSLLNNNTNLNNPFRLDRIDSKIVAVCDNDHRSSAIQRSYNGGLLNKFVVNKSDSNSKGCNPDQPMGYFDGNTVTALWNYAQNFAMSDNFYSTNFGASLAGHINLISGQIHGVIPKYLKDDTSNGTLIGDPDSSYDNCSKNPTIFFTGKNLGDMLNKKNVTWGWFQGGFKPSNRITTNNSDNSSIGSSKAVCSSAHLNIANQNITDYVVHHEPFQYYKSTSNPHHLPPNSTYMIGKTDQANHQYDLSDFWNAAENGTLPAVSFLKPSQYQTGHPGYSDPLDEQTFIVNTINKLQTLKEWNNTAIIIAYDDSGGWYDHVMPPIISQSNDPKYDTLLGHDGLCGHISNGAYQDRCGYGGRLPMLVVSPFAKINYISHQITDQTSILRFIEDNWNLGQVGDQSFDAKAGSIMDMFNFTKGHYANRLFLNPIYGTIDNSH
jgi:phospholipase C